MEGGELKFPDGEGNVAGGRTGFWFCGNELLFVMGGTLTVGCCGFPLFIFRGGSVNGGACIGGAIAPGDIGEVLYIPGEKLPGNCAGGIVLGVCGV